MYKNVSQKKKYYGVIGRGTSLTIPVEIKDEQEKPLDLTGMQISFTAKKVQYDYDYEDTRAYIVKDFEPQSPEYGKFYIQLTSKDTDFAPGRFCFDIEIMNPENGMVNRICTLEFDLEGGPTNRTVNGGIGQLPVGDEITILLQQGNPIVVIAPTVAIDPNIYEKLTEIFERLDIEESQTQAIIAEIELIVERMEYLTTQVEKLL